MDDKAKLEARKALREQELAQLQQRSGQLQNALNDCMANIAAKLGAINELTEQIGELADAGGSAD